jgi:hypothetical protein
MGCRCRECFGFAEYMLEGTGQDYGLPRSPGHARPKPAPVAEVVQLRARPVRQPWMARPSRHAA